MARDLRKVAPGSRVLLSGTTFNTLVDVAKDYQGRRFPQGQAPGPQVPSAGWVLIRNDAEQDLSRGGVVGLGDPIFEPADDVAALRRGPVLSGVVPADPAHVGAFAVLLEPVADGAIGRAAIDGPVYALVDITSTDQAERADIADGRTDCLVSGGAGSARILWRETEETGLQWCACILQAWPRGGLLPVKVVQDGGTAGDKTTQCSYTYTVKDLGGTTMKKNAAGDSATGMTPQCTMRGTKGKMVKAADNSYAMAFYAGTDLVLWQTTEQPATGTGSCA